MSDFYVVIHIATTCDESTAYVPRDATEVIALSWTTVDSRTLETSELHNVLVRPVNTPITPHCQQVHGISWDQVRVAGTFQDAISQIDADISSSLAGSDFSVVTFDASEIRVQLQREARDKNVTLPDWLRLPRVFELPVEFSNWSAKDDSKDAKDASLATIAAAMGVENNEERKITEKENEEGERSNKEKDENEKVDNGKVDEKVGEKDESKNKKDSQSPADDGLIRGLGENTCVVYANILVALAKAALPVEEHPQVLTHPHDSAQDHAAFEAERSKVVYLSNLLPDTTQPELELWFAQSGGRPAAFWMLSNADPAARRGHAGFAIFASHEDAADALAMNGRVLNDRAVEVQPSSARVLDRATELLVSFPLLRNRPRPGDWTCPSCGFSNFQRRTHCFRCLFPASSAVAIQESMYLGRKPGFAGLSAYGYGDNGYQSGGNGYYYNGGGGGGGQRFGNSVPFRAGDWKCELCMYHNFAKNLACLKCSAAKPAATASGMLSVNLTAAAIAAATASGQPLNLGGGLMGLQQPQPMHAQFSRNNLTSSSNSSASNTPRDKAYYGRNGTATPQGSLKGWLGYYKDDKGISSAMGLMSLDDGRRS